MVCFYCWEIFIRRKNRLLGKDSLDCRYFITIFYTLNQSLQLCRQGWINKPLNVDIFFQLLLYRSKHYNISNTLVCLVSWKCSIPALVKNPVYIAPVGSLFFFFLEVYLKFLRNLVGARLHYPGYVKILTWLLVVGNLAHGLPWRWERPARGKSSAGVAAS